MSRWVRTWTWFDQVPSLTWGRGGDVTCVAIAHTLHGTAIGLPIRPGVVPGGSTDRHIFHTWSLWVTVGDGPWPLSHALQLLQHGIDRMMSHDGPTCISGPRT